MECEYTATPLITADKYNIYVCRGDTITSSDVGVGKLGTVPCAISRFQRHEARYYFLDVEGRLWCDGNLVTTSVRDFNEHHVLDAQGKVWTVDGVALPLPFTATSLVGDLLLSDQGVLYDRTGQYITSQVVSAHTDGNEIIVVHQGSVLEYVGDNTDKQQLLRVILQVQGAQKAVVNQGSILLLLPGGVLVAAGANKNCECGVEEPDVLLPRQLLFPAPVLDFSFNQHVGWALLADHSLYVWGYNDTSSPFFLQWPKEQYISPRLLPL